MSKLPDNNFILSGRRTVELECQAIQLLAERMDSTFSQACRLIMGCRGKVVVTGIGKSGHIAGKIAATLASTGTPAFFLHPAEAIHGDIGMVTGEDVVIALSNSGAAPELLSLLPVWKRLQVKLIALSGHSGSLLVQAADIWLDTSVEAEACPHDLAPTASTTASLVMGDALAIALLEARGFSADDFALSHPGGTLGKRLLLRVDDIMHCSDEVPAVLSDSTLAEALTIISRYGFGFTTVNDREGRMVGVFSDGDLRRALEQGAEVHTARMEDWMTRGGTRIEVSSLAVDALNLMENRKITVLVCVDEKTQVKGILHLHDLLRAGLT